MNPDWSVSVSSSEMLVTISLTLSLVFSASGYFIQIYSAAQESWHNILFSFLLSYFDKNTKIRAPVNVLGYFYPLRWPSVLLYPGMSLPLYSLPYFNIRNFIQTPHHTTPRHRLQAGGGDGGGGGSCLDVG